MSVKNKNQKSKSRPKQPKKPRGRKKPGNGSQKPKFGIDSKRLVAPVAMTNVVRTNRPKFTTLDNGDCRITHREYIGDITAGLATPSVFNLNSFALNPGQGGTFPWLSRIAANYESYVFESLNFCYETEASTNLGGTVIMAIDYDAVDNPPISKQQAMAYRSSIRTSPWNGVRHRSVREDLQKSKSFYIRTLTQPLNTDLKTYDTGVLYVISQGVSTSGATLGELYVEYTVKLLTPAFGIAFDSLVVGGSIASTGAGVTPANPFGTTPAVGNTNFGFSINGTSQLNIVYPGYYLCSWEGHGGTGVTGNGVVMNQGGTATRVYNNIDVAATQCVSTWIIITINPNTLASFTITATTITTASLFLATAPIGSL